MDKDKMIKIVEENIARLENKDFSLLFYVLDTKGNPSSALEYIYETAYVLHEKGYNVKMLHDEDNFVGVADWLGEKYANLPHANIKKENVDITASDFLFIPEIFANVMIQTKKLPCKRVILVQNAKHITEFFPVSQTLDGVSIVDAIVSTAAQADRLKSYFPEVRTHIVPPSIKKIFRNNDGARKLVVNIVAKDQSVVNQIVKPFYWRNPMYKFVSFNDLRGLDQETFSEALRQAAITIWADDTTQFGYTLLEALKCGSLVLAKVPLEPTEWMLDEKGELTDSVVWFNTVDELATVLPDALRSWTLDVIPQAVYDEQQKIADRYTEEEQAAAIEQVYEKEIIAKRLADFKEALADIVNNKEEVAENEE